MTDQPRPLDQTDENHMNPTLKGLDQWPNTSSLPPSSPVEAFSGPGRVETAEEAFDAWRDKTEEHCRKQGYGWPDKIDCGLAFKAGHEAGRKA